MKVDLLQAELATAAVTGGVADHVRDLHGVPLRSLAMLVCKANFSTEAGNGYPFRPPETPLSKQLVFRGTGNSVAVPAFLIHFS